MKRTLNRVLGAVATAFCIATLSPAGAQEAKIAVQVDQPGHKISPTLFGIFFEDINLSADGGIYPELVRNRNFEDSEKPEHWTLTSSGLAKVGSYQVAKYLTLLVACAFPCLAGV